jgi:hypothetical protein
MKILVNFLLVTFFWSSTLFSTYGQYITLVGKQFKDGEGNNFYPIMCNYSCQLAYGAELIEDLSNSYVTPIKDYGVGYGSPSPNINFECNDQPGCQEQLNQDFQKLLSMGFNTVRIMGLSPTKVLDPAVNPGFYINTEFNNYSGNWKGTVFNILPPYQTNPPGGNILLEQLFHFWDIVLEVASQNGLKIIFVVGWGDIAALNEYLDYADYLTAVANHFRTNQTLMAYEVMQEPTGVLNYHNYGYLKSDVCKITSAWYDSLKRYDSNHLVTLGASLYELWEWDPAVMKIDFFSAHIYPDIQNAFEDSTDFYNTCRIKRVLGVMAWLDSECPIPWIIGETGYRAQDDYYYDKNNWVPQPVYYPNVHGNLLQQKKYADTTLQYVRNCHGSGYAWWNYQENWWSITEDGYGLLRHGDISTPNIEKDVVDAFKDYANPPPAPQPYSIPDTYYQPYICSIGNGFYPVYGQVIDQNFLEVGNALIRGVHYSMPGTFGISIYAFSDSLNGTFTISNPKNDIKYLFNMVSITGIGTSVLHITNLFDSTGQNTPASYQVTNSVLDYISTISDLNIEIGDNRSFKAWNSIDLINVNIKGNGIIGGTAEFVSRESTHVNPSFRAQIGSNVHLWNAQTFPDCGNLLFMPTNNPSLGSLMMDFPKKSIDLDFIPTCTDYSLTPNPSNGLINIQRSYYCDSTDSPTTIRVYNLLGQIVFSQMFNQNSIIIDISQQGNGVYIVSIDDNTCIIVKKIIVL